MKKTLKEEIEQLAMNFGEPTKIQELPKAGESVFISTAPSKKPEPVTVLRYVGDYVEIQYGVYETKMLIPKDKILGAMKANPQDIKNSKTMAPEPSSKAVRRGGPLD